MSAIAFLATDLGIVVLSEGARTELGTGGRIIKGLKARKVYKVSDRCIITWIGMGFSGNEWNFVADHVKGNDPKTTICEIGEGLESKTKEDEGLQKLLLGEESNEPVPVIETFGYMNGKLKRYTLTTSKGFKPYRSIDITPADQSSTTFKGVRLGVISPGFKENKAPWEKYLQKELKDRRDYYFETHYTTDEQLARIAELANNAFTEMIQNLNSLGYKVGGQTFIEIIKNPYTE